MSIFCVLDQTTITLVINTSFHGKTVITLLVDENSPLARECEIEIKRDGLAAMAVGEKILAKDMSPIKRKVPTDDVIHLLTKLSGLRIPPVPSGTMGLDGTTYTLKIERMFNVASYTWWEDSPTGWEELEEIAQELIRISKEIEVDCPGGKVAK